MARDQIPGVAVGVVERGHLVFARGFGYRDVDTHLPVTPDTLFPLGSCSKAFTATAIALLADEGKIALDAPVRTYLPDFSLEDPVASATLTTRDLLTHRSGLPRHDLFWYQAPFSRDELYRRLRFLEPGGPPHAQWRYNSLMFVVAGRIVEKVSGESWESFVQARILSPLEHASHRPFGGSDGDRLRSCLPLRAARGQRTKDTHAEALERHRARGSRADRACGISPAGSRFTRRDRPRFSGRTMWRELHRPQAEMPAPDQPEVQHPYYALGWIHESYRGHPLVVHNGAIDGFTVHLGFLPETGQGLILLMNRDLATAALMALAYSAYDRLLGLEPLDWEARLKKRRHRCRMSLPSRSTFRSKRWWGDTSIPRTGRSRSGPTGTKLAMQFRTFRFTLAYQGKRRFLSQEPIARRGAADLGSVLEPEDWRVSEALRSAQLRCGRSRCRSSPA